VDRLPGAGICWWKRGSESLPGLAAELEEEGPPRGGVRDHFQRRGYVVEDVGVIDALVEHVIEVDARPQAVAVEVRAQAQVQVRLWRQAVEGDVAEAADRGTDRRQSGVD
jgi:hypothetical protein